MEIIKNYLDKNYFKDLKNKILIEKKFPFFYNDAIANKSDQKKLTDFYFFHIIYENLTPQSEAFYLLNPFFIKLKIKSLLRVKVNLYTRTEQIIKHNMHNDFPFEHKGAILSLNTCDGGTWVENKFVKSEENQVIFFDPSKPHCSTSCTDNQVRVNIILNYF
jgi:hypothetical protein